MNSIHPFMLIALFGAIAFVSIVIAWRARSGFVMAIMAGLALVFIIPAAWLFVALRPELVDDRFRTYKGFYNDIAVGMTREQVFAALERRYRKSGARQQPKVMDDEDNRLGFFMNPEKSREPNCEGIFLKMSNGVVISKVYSAD